MLSQGAVGLKLVWDRNSLAAFDVIQGWHIGGILPITDIDLS